MSGAIHPLPQYAFMAWCLVKHRDNFSFLLLPNDIITCEGVSKSFRTICLQREVQVIQLSGARCSCIAILWVNLVSFCRCNPSCCFWTSNTKGKSVFRYRLSPDTFGYNLVGLWCILNISVLRLDVCGNFFWGWGWDESVFSRCNFSEIDWTWIILYEWSLPVSYFQRRRTSWGRSKILRQHLD
jgi:hypothetical protein